MEHNQPSAESALIICYGTLSTFRLPCIMVHRDYILCYSTLTGPPISFRFILARFSSGGHTIRRAASSGRTSPSPKVSVASDTHRLQTKPHIAPQSAHHLPWPCSRLRVFVLFLARPATGERIILEPTARGFKRVLVRSDPSRIRPKRHLSFPTPIMAFL